MTADLGGLLGNVGSVLLDFDGPVCTVFAGCPAPQVAAGLLALLRAKGVELPEDVAAESDPLEVLRWTGAHEGQIVTRAVEDALCEAERRAVSLATPTPFGREVIVAARQAGLPVAVVSNNSGGAVAAYLTAHRLTEHVSPIIGRAYGEPSRMKPNPEPILRAVETHEVQPHRAVLVGDSLSDIEGARAAGVRVIGYANRPSKEAPFREAGADIVITTMGDIASALIERSSV